MKTKRWQDWVILALGIWLFLSPWILGFYEQMAQASWNFFVLGVALAVSAGFALSQRALWEEWVNLALGVWLIVSPWVLRFADIARARDDAVIVGVIAAALAAWALFEQRSGVGGAPGDRSLTH